MIRVVPRNRPNSKRAFAVLVTGALLLVSSTWNLFVPVARAATVAASTFAELTSALASAADGDTIKLTRDIVATSTVTVTSGITIDGQGFGLSVPRPGLTEAGIFDSGASNFRAIVVNASGKNVTVKNLAVKGGYSSSYGNGISVSAGTVLLDKVEISQSRGQGFSGGGGGLYVNSGAVVTLRDSSVYRNSALYGGGFVAKGRLVVLRSTFSENRSESAAGGGGAGEVQSGGNLFIVNSTFSNNQSTEIGGAINNYYGTLFVASSTFTGNVAYGSYGGGAIGQNGGSVTVVSSLFAHNYQRTGGTSSNPTSWELDDLDPHSGTPKVLYSVIHDASTNFAAGSGNNVTYTGAADGSDGSLFAGGISTKITDGTGTEIGSANIFRPFVVKDGSVVGAVLKTGSFASLSANRGTNVRFESSGATQKMSYHDRSAGTPAWVDITGTPASGSEITTDQFGNNRAATPWAGSLEETQSNLVSLKVKSASNGSVSGGSLFGDVYPSGAEVRLTALPNAGYGFTKWVNGAGTDVGVANPYVFTLSVDTVLQPVFGAVAAGTYTVSYSANGATSGSPPATVVTSSSTLVSNKGTLARAGYDFVEWNTQPNGSGTSYLPGASYSSGVNVTLYAMWTVAAATTTTVPPPAPSTTVVTPTTVVSPSSTLSQSGTTTTIVGTPITPVGPSTDSTTTTVASKGSAAGVSSSPTTAASSGAGGPVVTVTPSVAATTTTAVGAYTTVELPETPEGGAGALVAGEQVSVELSREDNELIAVAGPIAVRIWGTTAGGDKVALDADGQLRLLQGDKITAEVGGFDPASTAEVQLHSTPVLLGRETVPESGTLRGSYPIPAATSDGFHRVVLVGSARNEPVTFALSFAVGEPPAGLSPWVIVAPIGLAIGGAMLLPVALRRRRREDSTAT